MKLYEKKLLQFFEENKFRVMLLKNCVPHGIQILDDYNLEDWDSSKVLDVMWRNGYSYSAHILRFGGKKINFIH